ncbi:FAD-dependent oxidoreductase [Streptomyces sp. NPDC058066]|uniref:FAD-dependent oxidoreductase n=1 Tax=Streptomyces sp. NPDC058066 TaxID=3346323 RepID=UPI0036E8FFFF
MTATGGVTFSELGWAAPPTDATAPPDGALSCYVAVVGGGYAGMATDLRLAERGADVVLLEAGFRGCPRGPRHGLADHRGSRPRSSSTARPCAHCGHSTGGRIDGHIRYDMSPPRDTQP